MSNFLNGAQDSLEIVAATVLGRGGSSLDRQKSRKRELQHGSKFIFVGALRYFHRICKMADGRRLPPSTYPPSASEMNWTRCQVDREAVLA